eukprot:jgi/Psemu1/319672/estExt_fgenesh1_pm.C_2730002
MIPNFQKCMLDVPFKSPSIRTEPLLLRAARGENVERTPVWMMRQAGRHMQAYRNLLNQYPTFRQRSETPDVSMEISLQPLERYGIDGVILFSDILTPLPAMGINFDITEGGNIQITPIRTRSELTKRLHQVSKIEFEEKCHFVGSVLKELRRKFASSSPDTTMLGFVGLPFTLASYLVEGKTGVSDGFPNVRELMKENPDILHDMLALLADNIINYACYQIDSGAQVVQVFDSWAGHVCDKDYEKFCEPYQRRVVQGIKQQHMDTPVIIYMAPGPYSTGGRRVQQLAGTGVDVVSIDHTLDIELGLEMLADYTNVGLQGNLDPQILRDGPLEAIRSQTLSILEKIHGRKRCILNLGHGILPDTPETHAELFVETVKSFKRDC